MWDLKACAVCLRTKMKMHNMSIGTLRRDYNLVSGLKTEAGEGLPDYLCVECAAYVKRFKEFRDKCHRAHYTMLELLSKNKEISVSTLESLNPSLLNVSPNLSFLKLENVHYETVKFKWAKQMRSAVNTGDKIFLHHLSTIDPNVIYEVPIVASESTAKTKVSKKEIKLEKEVEEHAFEESYMDDVNDAFDSTVEPEPEPEPEPCGSKPVEKEEDNIQMLFDTIFGISNEKDANEFPETDSKDSKPKENEAEDDADGSQFEEEYATIVPLSVQEIKAVVDVYKMLGNGKHKCKICAKSCHNENRLKVHMRMHDKHTSGTFYCSLCSYYYKTEFLLKTHVSDKHMYKYICKKCPEITYDKTSAKQHFIWTHLQKGNKKNANWYDGKARPSWLSTRGGKKKRKCVLTLRSVRKTKKFPKDFPKQAPLPQEEQYEIIQERKKSKNYLESTFKCQLCYRGFREQSTFSKHMKKHDPVHSGELQCDMCKLHFPNTRKMYKHMRICHTYKYTCQLCSYVCYNRSSANMHYQFHKNVTFTCPHCDMVFNKMSTRLTHIRLKHPSTCVCDICGHSFVSDTGLYFHKKISHTKEEVEASANTPVQTEDPLYCFDCGIQFRSQEAFTTHFGSSSKHSQVNTSVKSFTKGSRGGGRGRKKREDSEAAKYIVNNGMPTTNDCELCGETLRNDVAARKHYAAVHPGADFLRRYMCDICGHITKQYANLLVHMRSHTQEKPYPCPHCDRKFSMASNRDRHLIVHTGEKRYQCQHCSRRFTQSSAVKLHIQTVHLKIPYAPWDKKNRKRRKELEAAAPTPLPPKYMAETQGNYLGAYINYSDE